MTPPVDDGRVPAHASPPLSRGAARFDAPRNQRSASRYVNHRNAIWPPADVVQLLSLDLSSRAPALGEQFSSALARLGVLVRHELDIAKSGAGPTDRRFQQAAEVAGVMRQIAATLPHPADRALLLVRADCVEHGYTDEALAKLAGADAEVVVFAASLSTWFGKEIARHPTAFAATIDAGLEGAIAPLQDDGPLQRYLSTLLFEGLD